MSYTQLLDKFVISKENIGQSDHSHDRSKTQDNTKRHENIKENYFQNAKNSDSYYNVELLFNYNLT